MNLSRCIFPPDSWQYSRIADNVLIAQVPGYPVHAEKTA